MTFVSTKDYKLITHIKFILSLGFFRLISEIQMTLQVIFIFSHYSKSFHFLLRTTSGL